MTLWFWIDLVSTIPYTWILAYSQGLSIRAIESDDVALVAPDITKVVANTTIAMNATDTDSSGGSGSSALAEAPQLLKLLKVAKLLKMLKILRVMKVKKLIAKFEEYIVTDSMDLMVTFFNITIKIIIMAHYMSCLFFYVGMDEVRANMDGWIVKFNIDKMSLEDRYITSMYWAFTTMSGVGYGDLTPQTRIERTVCLLLMMFSCGIFAYIVNSIGNIVSRFNRIATSFREKMLYINRYLAEKKDFPPEIRNKVRRYLDYVFDQKQDIKVDEREVYMLLNERLKEKLQMHLRGRIVSGIQMFQAFGIEFLSDITTCFRPQTYVVDDFLFME